MTTTLIPILSAIAAAIVVLLLTPVTMWLAAKVGAVDVPSARRIHTRAIPRLGGVAIVLGFLLLVSLLLSAAIAALNKYLNYYLGLPVEVWTVLAAFVSMALLALLFATLFKMLPDMQVRWREVWVGAVATAVLFELGKFGLGYYLGRESTASTYGAAASVVLLLLWVYYASCILLFGAEFTQVYARASGRHVKPAPHAELITEESSGKHPMTVSGKPAEVRDEKV